MRGKNQSDFSSNLSSDSLTRQRFPHKMDFLDFRLVFQDHKYSACKAKNMHA